MHVWEVLLKIWFCRQVLLFYYGYNCKSTLPQFWTTVYETSAIINPILDLHVSYNF